MSSGTPSERNNEAMDSLLEGRIELRKKLGTGSFATVWEGFDNELRRHVAVKILHASRQTDESVRRFFAEAQITANLAHANIVPIYDYGQEATGAKRFYIINKLIDGVTLGEWVEFTKLDDKEIATLFASLAGALDHAHEHHVFHRDIKPENILVDLAGRPYLTDFGLAREEGVDRTSDNVSVGTVAFMSPEQATYGGSKVDGRSDIYSIGVVLYQCLTGRLPYRASEIGGYLSAILNEVPPPPSAVNQDIPKDLSVICEKCLAKDVNDRFSSSRELKEDLGRFIRGEPILSRRVSRFERTRKWFARNPNVAILSTALTVVLAASLAITSVLASVFNSERKRADNNASELSKTVVESLLNARSENVPMLLGVLRSITESYRPRVKEQLNREVEESDDTRRSTNAVYGLAELGEFEEQRIFELISSGVAKSDGVNLVNALKQSPDFQQTMNRMIEVAEASQSEEVLARFAVVSWFAGDRRLAERCMTPAKNPNRFTKFVFRLPDWHGDLKNVAHRLRQSNDGDEVFALLSSLALVEKEKIAQPILNDLIRVASEIAQHHRDAGCNVAAIHLLRSWGEPEPKLAGNGSEHRLVLERQDVLLVKVNSASTSTPSGFFMSTTEVSNRQFQQFLKECNRKPDRPKTGEPTSPVIFVTFNDVALFCNWLSAGERQNTSLHVERQRKPRFGKLVDNRFQRGWIPTPNDN